MSQQIINIGTAANDGTGDQLRTAFDKSNDNFTELYNGAGAVASVPQEGRLTYVSATALKFAPFNGNKIKVNGSIYTIPNAGIAGLTNTGVFINGTGGSSLAANATYLIFAFLNSGTITADFQTTGRTHVTSTMAGNEGVEILNSGSNDDTRTLIGMCRTNASSQFVDTPAQRFVRSWYNCLPVDLISTVLAGETTTSNSWVELASSKRIEFVKWAGELVDINFTGALRNQTLGAYAAASIGIDSATSASPESGGHSSTANFRLPISSRYTSTGLSEGYHDGRMLGAAAGTSTAEFISPVIGSSVGSRLNGQLGGV